MESSREVHEFEEIENAILGQNTRHLEAKVYWLYLDTIKKIY